MILQIEIRNVYGDDKAYPVGLVATQFARIANTKTLTRGTLQAALAMGCTLEVLDRYGQVSRSFSPADALNVLAVR